jgi:hypothetical protein
MRLMGSFQQAPVRNESAIGAQVYSHSEEFSTHKPGTTEDNKQVNRKSYKRNTIPDFTFL